MSKDDDNKQPQPSRRDFLIGGAALAAGLAVAPRALAAPAPIGFI